MGSHEEGVVCLGFLSGGAGKGFACLGVEGVMCCDVCLPLDGRWIMKSCR